MPYVIQYKPVDSTDWRYIGKDDYESWVTMAYNINEATSYPTKEKAEKIWKWWQTNYHPWYGKPTKEYNILEVIPKYKQVLTGWEVV